VRTELLPKHGKQKSHNTRKDLQSHMNSEGCQGKKDEFSGTHRKKSQYSSNLQVGKQFSQRDKVKRTHQTTGRRRWVEMNSSNTTQRISRGPARGIFQRPPSLLGEGVGAQDGNVLHRIKYLRGMRGTSPSERGRR